MSILVIRHSPSAGPMRLNDTLNELGHKLRTVCLFDGDQLPPDLDDVDGLISCGGTTSANDDSLDWLAPEMKLIEQAHELDMPIIGLGLGCQIIARALGGKVGPVENKIQLGWMEAQLSDVGKEDPLHSGIAWSHHVFHFNREQVIELPAGARILASSKRCKVESWTCGMRTYGFQYRPEIYHNTIDRWMSDDPYAIEEAGLSREQLAFDTEKYFPAFERLTDRLFHFAALLLMPVDRRYQGIAKELHH